jgi:amino acid transporter
LETGVSTEAGVEPPAERKTLFVRNATGMVRDVGSTTSFVINFTPGSPAQGLGAGLLFALALFPGGNFYLALLFAVPMMLSWAYAYGLLTAAMPRTGGDYTLISRILGAPFGIVAAFSQMMANFLSVAFFCVVIVGTAIGPMLVAFGLLNHDPGLVSWATSFGTSHGWQFGVGIALILFISAMMWGGWKWTNTILVSLFAIVIAGLAVSFFIALFTSHHGFVNDFNNFAAPYTHNHQAYADTLANARKAGVNPSAPFSFGKTLPMVGVLGTLIIFTYFSTYVGAELRRGRSTATAHRMALAGWANCAFLAIAVFVFFHTFGKPFVTAAFGGFVPSSAPILPYYFTLPGVIAHSAILVLLLGISYVAFWPTIGFVASLAPVRILFAFAFDGILPQQVTKVSRNHAPWVAILITAILTALVLLWAVFISTSFLQVIVYATMVQLIAMTLLGFTALVFPWRRPDLFRASVSQARFLGIPVVSIAGLVAILSGAALFVLYFHYPLLGVAHPASALEWMGGTTLAALLFYVGARVVRQRQGVDLGLVYSEIPPE